MRATSEGRVGEGRIELTQIGHGAGWSRGCSWRKSCTSLLSSSASITLNERSSEEVASDRCVLAVERTNRHVESIIYDLITYSAYRVTRDHASKVLTTEIVHALELRRGGNLARNEIDGVWPRQAHLPNWYSFEAESHLPTTIEPMRIMWNDRPLKEDPYGARP